MVVPAARRLRRLRWQMTLAFTLANLIGLVVLAGVALKVDGASAYRNEYAEALRRVNTAQALVHSETGQLDLRYLRHDPVAVGHPELYVLVHSDLTVVFMSRGGRHAVSADQLRGAARMALADAGSITVDARDTRGNHIYLLGQRFYDDVQDDQVAGVVVAVGDPDAGAAEHRSLLWALLAGTITLVLVSSAVGHTLAGRAVRPAVASLSQQERFLADASHELRTPVAALRAAAEAALAESAAPPTAANPSGGEVSRARLKDIARDARRLSLLVEALLTRARLKSGVQATQREPLRLDLLVEDVIADLSDGGLLDGEVSFSSTAVVAEADPTLVRMAVRNLIDNALRHGRHPGRPATVRVSVEPKTVVVRDNGPGVPQSMVDGAFVRYTTGSYDGTGLGLSIVAEVAAAHDGARRP
jgi:signal transduction histidine kinase